MQDVCPLSRGYRELTEQGLVLPPSTSPAGYSIGVSCVSFNGQNFVCGMRVFGQPGPVEISGVNFGLINPETETVIQLRSEDVLQGFEVAVTIAGIVGLKFLIGGPSGRVSEWIGGFRDGDPNVAFAWRIARAGKQLRGVAATFDVSSQFSIFCRKYYIKSSTCRHRSVATYLSISTL